MTDNIAGFLEVGLNDHGDIVINHMDLKLDRDGAGHIVFSPRQARHLAALLNSLADESEEGEKHER